jgi:hypothetical protein
MIVVVGWEESLAKLCQTGYGLGMLEACAQWWWSHHSVGWWLP